MQDAQLVPTPAPAHVEGDAGETSKRGHHVHKAGKRVKQIGATFVIGAGDRVRYEHMDADSTDHADIDEVVAALCRT